MKKLYRTPTEEITSDQQAYLDAWSSLGAKIEAVLPSYYVGGYDPGFLLHPRDMGNGSFTLPTRAALEILNKHERKK